MPDSRSASSVKGTLLNSALTRRGISVVLLVIVFSILIAAFALKSMRHTSREHVAGMLTQMVDSTYRMMQFWEAQQRMEVEGWARAPEVVALTAGLLADSPGFGPSENELRPESERKQAAGAELRRLLQPERLQHGFDGFFLFDSEGRLLATSLDSGTSVENLPIEARVLQTVFAGETVLSLPASSNQADAQSTIPRMYVATPVRDSQGRILAALVFRLNPQSDFSRLSLMAQSGASGEAYLLDADARMLTGSRFEAQLSQIGLLQTGQSSIQSVRAIDPGKNLWLEPGLPADYANRPLTRMAAALAAGESGMDLIGYRGYRGVPVVGAWHWYPDKGYGVAAEIDVDEAYEMFGSMRAMLFAVLIVMILVFMAMVLLMEGLNRRAGKALGLSEARYRQLFNLIPDAIVVHSDAKIIYCNPAAVKMFAASSEDELIGRGALDLVHPDDRQRVAERISRVKRPAGIEEMQEECLLRVDGTSFIAEVEGCAFLDAEGLDAVLVVARDISDRKLVEQERERLRVAVEQTPEGIMIADAKGDILYANPGAATMTGRSLQELDGMSAAQARGGSVGDETYMDIVRSLQAGESWYGEFILIRPGGESLTIERRVTPVIVSGKTQYHVSVDRDITEERRQQEQMEHTQRLESLGVLAGGIAHDFNNILAAIMGNASMAAAKTVGQADTTKHLKRIENASQRAAELCRQMLAYSGKGKFVVRPINLSLMLKDIGKLLEVSVTKFAELHVDVAEDLPAVQADVTQLQQVIMNLVINASDAIGEQSGSITLRTGIKRVQAGQCEQTYTGELLNEGEYVFLEVRDTGCGMNADIRKKLFDPFYSTKFTGRGLGMSAVLGIVRGHHGAIIVESEPGEGSCFRVLLPVFSGAVGAGLGEEDEAVDWCPTGTVLVVDDEEVVRETAAMMLEDIGFHTLAAVDGVEALEIYREHSEEIALVLLDMTMPRMDGHSCFEQLRSINPQVRVVLSSGYNEKNVTHVFADNELAGFVQKPYRLTTLRAKLREALEV